MSYTKIKIPEIKSFLEFRGYSLCYVEEIPETVIGYTSETKAYMSRPGFSMEQEILTWGYHSPNIHYEEQPNPDRIIGEEEYIAYFTPLPLNEQWGDDWDDSPYEHNAGRPYDHDNDQKEVDIILIPFAIKNVRPWIKFPESYSFGGNSPFSVSDINFGAVAWIFAACKPTSIAIPAGIGIKEFITLINKIEKL